MTVNANSHRSDRRQRQQRPEPEGVANTVVEAALGTWRMPHACRPRRPC